MLVALVNAKDCGSNIEALIYFKAICGTGVPSIAKSSSVSVQSTQGDAF